MRILQAVLLSLFLLLITALPSVSQDTGSPAASPAPPAASSAPQTAPSAPPAASTDAAPAPQSAPALSTPPSVSFNEVIDRVVEREHFFLAQMRHMRPLVETYLQDMKAEKDGHAVPSKDQY